jgi:hypothetical protein
LHGGDSDLATLANSFTTEPRIFNEGGTYYLTSVHAKGWVPKDRVKLFTQTANSPDAIGNEARHAETKFDPPKKPMSLVEAGEVVDALLSGWLASKGL